MKKKKNLTDLNLNEGSFPIGWLPLKTIAISSSPMNVTPKPFSTPTSQNFTLSQVLTDLWQHVYKDGGKKDTASKTQYNAWKEDSQILKLKS